MRALSFKKTASAACGERPVRGITGAASRNLGDFSVLSSRGAQLFAAARSCVFIQFLCSRRQSPTIFSMASRGMDSSATATSTTVEWVLRAFLTMAVAFS